MNQHIIDNYYTNIGQSYYTSAEFHELMASSDRQFKPISRFGIGILSCFMVCDNMEVETKRIRGAYQTDEAINISIEGYDSLFVIKTGTRYEPGTKTVLELRTVHPWQRMVQSEFIACVKKLIPLPPFDVEIQTDDTKEICSPNLFEELDLTRADDHSWDNEDNISILEFSLNDSTKGFRGKAAMALGVKNKLCKCFT